MCMDFVMEMLTQLVGSIKYVFQIDDYRMQELLSVLINVYQSMDLLVHVVNEAKSH
jgi:hypothetical protein